MIYGVYLAYHKSEVLPDKMLDGFPAYPKEIAKVRAYDNANSQFEAYANTMCPASQLFEAKDEIEFKQKVKELQDCFLNEEWLEKNIYPYC